jgi:hypothetical protein
MVAQYNLTTITPNGPAHALMPDFGYQKFTADTVYYIAHVPNPFDKQIYHWDENSENPLVTGYTIHKYSPDFLIDTMHVFSGLMRTDIKYFDDKYRTVRYIFDYPHCKIIKCNIEVSRYSYDLQEFEYDTENRVSKITNKIVSFESGVETETLVNTELYDYSTIKMTNKGYIYNGYECEMDALNRITYLKNLTEMPNGYYEPEYMELNGKKYRVGDKYYTYSDGAVSTFGYERTSFSMIGWSDRWVKVDYFFNDEGQISYKNSYYSFDGETWEVWEKRETRYAYVEHNNTDVRNICIDSSNVNVYGISGAIIVNSDKNTDGNEFKYLMD